MTITPDTIAICQHPDGEELHIPLADMSGSCFCDHGEEYTDTHGARPYVAIDAVVQILRDSSASFAGAHVNAGVALGDVRRRLDALASTREQKQ